ncbi:MAG: copper chaperone PCu(A)C [bacterium]|nr:copper chaperone PCu(A)C [bacterium]
MRRNRLIAALLLVSVTFATWTGVAAADTGEIRVANGRVTLPFADEAPSVYFVLRNGSTRTRTIVGASCDCAEKVSIRRTAVDEDGQWSSEPMPGGMPVPAGGDVAFVDRGLFLRLMSPRTLTGGEKLEIILEFADGEKVPFEAIVEDE